MATKQTAVEWLKSKLTRCVTATDERQAFEQAKAMEREKHIKWNNFLETEKKFGISDVKTIERIQWYYNEYFNETYNKQDNGK